MPTTTITIRIDEELKKQAEALFNEIGMSTTTAFTIFVKASVRQQRIPFELTPIPTCKEASQNFLGKNTKETNE